MGIWAQASALAEQTPPERNRYVDFLRAASILFVIIGHWLIATAVYDADRQTVESVMILEVQPWTQWLSWLFQVMPIFFIVGGYSNAVSLESARKAHSNYATWLVTRLHRLLSPLLLLVVFWAGLSYVMHLVGAREKTIVFASQAALVPTWFLAVYTAIVLLAPASYRLWKRWGYASFWGFVLLAALTELAFFRYDLAFLGWSNTAWVWLAMHHLGFAWRDGRLRKPPVLLIFALLAFAALCTLILIGPYPLAMAGSPGDSISNTLPPKITLVALGLTQFGLLLAAEKPMQRWLAKPARWTGTVIINTMIMTIYLWHMTILVVLLALLYLFDGFGLTVDPGSAQWWWSRIPWMLTLACLLLPVAMLVSPLERRARTKEASIPPAIRQILGAALAAPGITFLTLYGFDGDPLSGFHVGALAMILVGAALCGVKLKYQA